tara:strand:+ start:19 stop:825 length:807 start_codon:yes stop_codon:yes gene_type:complete
MAIAVAARALAKKLLKNKKLKKAINVTTKQTNKLKNAAKSGAAKVAASGAVTGAAAKATQVGKTAMAKAKPAVQKLTEKTKPVLEKTKNVAKDTTTKASAAVGAGVTATKKAATKATEKVKSLNKDKIINAVGGPITKGEVIGASAALTGLGAVALTASMLKSSTPKESEYTVNRLRDGRFSTTFKDKNANAVFSAQQLTAKEIDDVRTRLAILDSIVLSNDPSKRKQEFIETATYLATKYKISNITGNNLSLIIPNVEGGVQRVKRA